DRPVPDNEGGFINLDRAPDPFPGFPLLGTNHYLYGLQEIVGWKFGIKQAKKLTYEGRGPKAPAAMETTLPGWERIRVYLQGSLPEAPLSAILWLTHGIHSRLVERRKSASGELSRMDALLAFLDSKWNGFYFQVPYSKERVAIVEPVHALM